MPDPARAVAALEVRDLRQGDLEEVIRIDALHTGQASPGYWKTVFADFVGRRADHPRVGLAAVAGGRLLGYLLGEVRAFEFGSEACGWIFGVGVDPSELRRGVASTLLGEACRRFHAAGVRRIRTMVRRNNVPVLSFFRANGFAAGSFVQLELELEEEP